MIRALGLAAVLLTFAPFLAADEPCPPCPPVEEEPPPAPLWETSLGLSYVATTGNTETSTVGGDLAARRRPVPWGLEITASYVRSEERDEVQGERSFVGLRGVRSLGERWEVFAGLSGEDDEFAGFHLRAVASAGTTYHALLGPRHLLDLDAGLTYTDVDRVGDATDDTFAGALLGGEYAWKFSETASFSQAATWFPNFEDSDDWRLESLTALEAALNEWLALRLAYEVRHRNEPAPGREDTDSTARVSLVLNL